MHQYIAEGLDRGEVHFLQGGAEAGLADIGVGHQQGPLDIEQARLAAIQGQVEGALGDHHQGFTAIRRQALSEGGSEPGCVEQFHVPMSF
ncbi:hypothetical protein D3C81_2168510 [compost metagenome]